MAERLNWARDGAHWPHRAHSRFVEAGGCRWHVQVIGDGDGPVLWLLHGTGAASHSWRGLVPLLAGRATLVVPDLPGHGFSDRLPAARPSIVGMAAALADLARVLGLPPGMVVGHSAGAALAVRAVLDGGLTPTALVGINAALMPFDGLAGRVLAPMARLMSCQPLVPWLFARSARAPEAVKRVVASTGSELDAEGLALYGLLMRQPAHVAGALAMMADWDLAGLWRQLPQLATPLLLLAGSQDVTVPPSQAWRVRERLPAARVCVLPGLGHLAHEEAPAVVAAVLLPLLEGRPAV